MTIPTTRNTPFSGSLLRQLLGSSSVVFSIASCHIDANFAFGFIYGTVDAGGTEDVSVHNFGTTHITEPLIFKSVPHFDKHHSPSFSTLKWAPSTTVLTAAIKVQEPQGFSSTGVNHFRDSTRYPNLFSRHLHLVSDRKVLLLVDPSNQVPERTPTYSLNHS